MWAVRGEVGECWGSETGLDLQAAPPRRGTQPGRISCRIVRTCICDWETSARLGAMTAAYCVESQGTTTYGFTWDGFAERFEKAFGLAPAVQL